MLSLALRRAAAAHGARPFARLLSSLPDHKLITMPALSPTMEVGTIQEWKKKEGEPVEGGEVIAEIETDKATRSFEYNDDGFVARVFVDDGAADVPVGQPLAIIVEEEADIAAFKDYVPDAAAPAAAAPPAAAAAAPPPPAAPAAAAPAPAAAAVAAPAAAPAPVAAVPGARVLASPLARVNAAAAGVGLAGVAGTGPGGRVVAADVADAVASGVALPAGAATAAVPVVTATPAFTDMEVTKYRRVTAERLLQSKTTIPHYYLTVECAIDAMLSFRKGLNDRAGDDPTARVSVNDFVVKAAAAALRRVPEVNAQWLGDVIRQFHGADVCVAVQTDAGLITPIVTDADRKGVREIAADVKRLAASARDGSLAPEEFMGGTFTISNLGMFGVKEFAAIVNPPQAAILAVGATEQRVVPDPESESGYGTKSIMTVTLSCDHRVVDGAVGAQWLKEFRACIEDPVNMIV